MTIKFRKERETKNTWRYEEIAEDGITVIGTIYFQKWALKERFKTPPDTLTLTVEDGLL